MKCMAQMEKNSKMGMLVRYAAELQCQHWEVEGEDQVVPEYLVRLKPA